MWKKQQTAMVVTSRFPARPSLLTEWCSPAMPTSLSATLTRLSPRSATSPAARALPLPEKPGHPPHRRKSRDAEETPRLGLDGTTGWPSRDRHRSLRTYWMNALRASRRRENCFVSLEHRKSHPKSSLRDDLRASHLYAQSHPRTGGTAQAQHALAEPARFSSAGLSSNTAFTQRHLHVGPAMSRKRRLPVSSGRLTSRSSR